METVKILIKNWRNQTFYKYRSLENFEFILDILLNQRLFATTYENLNDPMEGIYEHWGLKDELIKAVNEGKKNTKICSLSTIKDEPLLWAHYADGSRGICIGLKVIEKYQDVYGDNVFYKGTPIIGNIVDSNDTARNILLFKHKSWEYEREFRFLKRSNQKAGSTHLNFQQL